MAESKRWSNGSGSSTSSDDWVILPPKGPLCFDDGRDWSRVSVQSLREAQKLAMEKQISQMPIVLQAEETEWTPEETDSTTEEQEATEPLLENSDETTESDDPEYARSLDARSKALTNFYKNKYIFITGGTSFLGKLLIRKLLKIFPDIKCIYLLIRRIDGEDANQRLQKFILDPAFQDVNLSKSKMLEKLVALEGDCTKAGLNLSEQNRRLLIENVSIVIHMIDAIFPNGNLSDALILNLQTTIEVGKLCTKMKNLSTFTYLTSAFAKIYDQDLDQDYKEKLFKIFDPEIKKKVIISSTFLSYINQYGNNYLFSKYIAESYIKERISRIVPSGVFGPGLLLPSAFEPNPGFCDDNFGMTKIIQFMMMGLAGLGYINEDAIAHVVPADLVANALINFTFEIALKSKMSNKKECLYRCCELVENPINWKSFKNLAKKNIRKYPYSKCLWFTCTTFDCETILYALDLNKIDLALEKGLDLIFGEESNMSNKKNLRKCTQYLAKYDPYLLDEWTFDAADCLQTDTFICPFNTNRFSWNTYMPKCIKGVRKYVLKELESPSKEDRKKMRAMHKCELLTQSIYLLLYFAIMIVFIILCFKIFSYVLANYFG